MQFLESIFKKSFLVIRIVSELGGGLLTSNRLITEMFIICLNVTSMYIFQHDMTCAFDENEADLILE